MTRDQQPRTSSQETNLSKAADRMHRDLAPTGVAHRPILAGRVTLGPDQAVILEPSRVDTTDTRFKRDLVGNMAGNCALQPVLHSEPEGATQR
jgi:hypothetical protein